MRDNAFDPEGERRAAGAAKDECAELAAKILVAIAPDVVQYLVKHQVPTVLQPHNINGAADMAVKMADALIARLNRNN